MSVSERPPPPSGDKWKSYAERLSDYLVRTRSKLAFLSTNEAAVDDGVLLWDSTGYPVVSKDGEYRQIVLSDGHGLFYITSDVTFAATGTAYALTYTASSDTHGFTQNGSKIIFGEDGHYLVSFSAQIYSTSSSTVNFAFWPRLNNVYLDGSTMRNALHQNGAALVVSRTTILEVSEGDELEVMAAVDNTSGSLKAFASSSVADEPATPATTLSIIRVHQ